MNAAIDRGDILCVRSTGWTSAMIRLGAALLDKPNTVNHVAIVHHLDDKGEWVCIEGRPGGVGWAPAAKYLDSPWTLSNVNQPKSPLQRRQIVDATQALMGRSYDWGAIAIDAARALRIDTPERWSGHWDAAHVICSSLAAYAYNLVGLGRPPGPLRTVTPANWADFVIAHRYD